MNGNDLNNMTKRYKEEMMRLYRQSSANRETSETPMSRQSSQPMQQAAPVQNNLTAEQPDERTAPMPQAMPKPAPRTETQQNISRAQSPAPANMTRDMAGTPIQGVPGASHFSAHIPSDSGATMPVTCECRFPSAESIIESIAGIPAHPIIRPEDNPPPVYPGSTPIQPRGNMEANNPMSNVPNNPMQNAARDINPNMGGTFSTQDKTAYNRNSDASLRGIFLNGDVNAPVYAVPSEAEEEKEIMPDFPLPRDSVNSIPSTAGFTPSMSWVSLTGENSWGFLQFEVFTAGGAYPVPGAVVIVKKMLPAGVGLVRVLFTDRSGRTPTIALPAPSPELSQNPMNTARPFSEYNVTVRARGFYTMKDIKIPIFAGIKTVQPIDLIPLPEYSGETPIQPRSDMMNNLMNDSNSVG
ncbi:MAG: hypothetical protein MSJ26_08415 [Oscillospiraceae bacterium]|nr:hypothetical protein [Oscillospiraceae bacterium]